MVEGRTRGPRHGDRQQATRCDVVALKVEDVAPHGYTIDRATVRQRKTGRPGKFELTEQTRHSVDDYLAAAAKKPAEFLFTGHRAIGRPMTHKRPSCLMRDPDLLRKRDHARPPQCRRRAGDVVLKLLGTPSDVSFCQRPAITPRLGHRARQGAFPSRALLDRE